MRKNKEQSKGIRGKVARKIKKKCHANQYFKGRKKISKKRVKGEDGSQEKKTLIRRNETTNSGRQNCEDEGK